MVTLALSGLSGVAEAHEFWVEAEDYTIGPDDRLIATIRVGEAFEGASYAFIPRNFRRFELAAGDAAPEPVDMRIGDRPALDVPAPEPGLVNVLHVTRNYPLEWETWDRFSDFLTHKDAAWVIDEHADRGFAQGPGVREVYSRYGKALVAVGDGAGADRSFGLATEIVALENPYTDDMSDGLDVALSYVGAPRTESQIEVFARDPEGVVEISTVTTDGDGRATVPVAPGHVYLLDAVVVRQPSDSARQTDPDAQWETLWASLTFAVPE